MSLLTFRSLWGLSKDWEQEFPVIKANGFTGIEASLADVGLPDDDDLFSRFCELLLKYNLKWICGLYTGWADYEFGEWKITSVDDHIKQFNNQISILNSLERQMLPIHVNCHTGCDSFTEDQAAELFQAIFKITSNFPIPISHESHRGRILGSPWMCLRMIEKFEELRLTLDLSHWNVVAERLIPIDMLRPIFCRIDHVHARIGTHEAPQVGNPRSAYSKYFTEYHENVWLNIWKMGLAAGKTCFTLTPEYGPMQDFYMPQVTMTGQDGVVIQYVEKELKILINDEQKKLYELFAKCKN